MKILIISHAAGTPEIGPNLRTFYLATKLSTNNHQVRVIGADKFHKYHKNPLQVYGRSDIIIEGVHYRWLKTTNYNNRFTQIINQISFGISFFQKMKDLVSFNPDIIIFSSPPPISLLPVVYFSKKINKKLILDIRDLWPEIIIDLGNFSKNNPYIFLVNKCIEFGYKNASGIVSVKKGDLGYIKSRYSVSCLTSYIPNGYDINQYQQKFSHPKLDEPSFKIVYVGALSNYYSIEPLLKIGPKLKLLSGNIKLIIVGDGEYKTRYENYIKEKKIDNICFLGYQPKKYIISILKKCDIAYLGLKNTKYNTHGISTNKLFEYMYSSIPIIASYYTKHDIVKEAKCGLTVDPEASDQIFEGIKKLYSMPVEERMSMGKKGFDFVSNNLNFDIIAKKYENFIEEVNN